MSIEPSWNFESTNAHRDEVKTKSGSSDQESGHIDTDFRKEILLYIYSQKIGF